MARFKFTALEVILLVLIQMECFQRNSSCPVVSDLELSADSVITLRDLAVKINNSIDFTVDPCFDFYKYVCENLNESDRLVKPSPDYNFVIRVFDEYIKNRENAALEHNELKVKQFFESCQGQMNQSLEDFLREFNFPNSIGGWPAFISDWSGENFDLTPAIAELNSYGVQIVVDLRTFRKYNQTDIIIAPEWIQKYSNEMDEYQKRLFPRDSMKLSKIGVPNASEVIENYFTVEEKYLNAIRTNTTENNIKRVISYKSLKEWTPEFDWEKYLKIFTRRTFEDHDQFTIIGAETIANLIKTLSEIEKKVLANFFFYKFLDLTYFVGNQEINCYKPTFHIFKQVFAKIIITNRFHDMDKKKLSEAFSYLIDVISDFSKLYGIETRNDIKADIKDFIFEDYLSKLTEEEVNEEFKDLEITSDSYYRNVINIVNRNVKEIIEIFFDRNTETNIIRQLLSESLIQTIYYGHNQPMSVLFNEIDLPFLQVFKKVSPTLLFPKLLYQQPMECFKQQIDFDDLDNYDLEKGKMLQNVLKAFNLWRENNQEMAMKEDEILKEFDLSNTKLFLISSMQISCRVNNSYSEKETRKHQFAWANLKEFGVEFNCPAGSPMNPIIRCNFL